MAVPPATRLTIELVPSSSWYDNVRSNVSRAEWDRLRRATAQTAGHRCEICSGRGRRWPVECHEVWSFDDDTGVQRLVRLIALCPACHEVKHIGLASRRGRYAVALGHLARTNGWSREDAELYAQAAFEQWARRSARDWTLDLTVLDAL